MKTLILSLTKSHPQWVPSQLSPVSHAYGNGDGGDGGGGVGYGDDDAGVTCGSCGFDSIAAHRKVINLSHVVRQRGA